MNKQYLINDTLTSQLELAFADADKLQEEMWKFLLEYSGTYSPELQAFHSLSISVVSRIHAIRMIMKEAK
jgi:hypothetical protein